MLKTLSLSTLSMVSAMSKLEEGVDLSSGFFTGFQMPKVSSEITTAYQVIEGQWQPAQPKEPCGEGQIVSAIEAIGDAFNNYENSPCKQGESSTCPSYTNAQQTIDFFHTTGIYSDLQSIIKYLDQYVQECELPKIESKLKADAIAEIKTIVSDLPYALYLKEAEDVFQMTRHFYSLVSAYDSKSYTNMGKQTGYVAFDMKCMYEGKSTFGFLDIDGLQDFAAVNTTNSSSSANSTLPIFEGTQMNTNSTAMNTTNKTANVTAPSAPNMTYANATFNHSMNSSANMTNMTQYAPPIKVTTKVNNKTDIETMRIVNRRTKNTTIVDGPQAAFMFIEQTHFVMTGQLKSFESCLKYDNQTDVMMALLSNMTEKVYGHKKSEKMKEAFTRDYTAINRMLIKGFLDCGVSKDLVWKIEMANKQLEYAEFQYTEELHMVLSNGTDINLNQTSNATNSTSNSTNSTVDFIPKSHISGSYVLYNLSINGTNFHSLMEQLNLHVQELRHHYYSKLPMNRTTNLYAHAGRAHGSFNSLIDVTAAKTSHPDDLAMYVWLMSVAVLVIGGSVGYIACRKNRKVGENQPQYAQIDAQPA